MATGYIDSNGNRHIISGMITGERPKYTMAEYTALTNKPIDWICTDYDATSEYGINDTEVKHDNTTVNEVLGNLKYENLITEITLTASETTTQNLISGKKFSDYNMISVIFYDSEYIRGSAVLSRNGSTGSFNALVPTLYGGTVSTNIIKSASDTAIYLDNRANTTLKVMVRGIKIV